ncbi:MAG: four helix bundle protein [Planctomycetota bacterium]
MAFARLCRAFIKRLPQSLANHEDARQLIRSSGSVGANYIDANESLSKKDFRMRVKIARKEAKETRYWARLVDTGQAADVDEQRDRIVQESTELMNILGAILRNSQ